MKSPLKWERTSHLKKSLVLHPLCLFVSNDNVCVELQHVFKHYDVNKDGSMDAKEFKQVCIDLGKRDITDDQVQEMIKQVDRNNDSLIQWNEFLDVIYQLQ